MENFAVDLSILISTIKHYSNDYSAFGDYYLISRINGLNSENKLDISMPISHGGVVFFLCLDGRASLDINLQHFDISTGTMAIIAPDDIVKIKEIEPSDFDAYTLFVSLDFIHDINIDVNAIDARILYSHNAPVFGLSGDEMSLIKHYFELLLLNTKLNDNDNYKKSISRCLLAAVSYQLMAFMTNHDTRQEANANHSRRMNYVHEFVRLAHIHHRTERTVGFYADKLYISPKYLSLIVKEATGKSAAQWIDEYVILDAKNMLRFSGKNIQQVAYDLNFTSQSSFGKYFKHLTGMSPSEFLKS